MSEAERHVWLAPYLPVSEEVSIGPWSVVPFRAFRAGRACSREVYREVRRLITAYKVDDALLRLGGVICPTKGRVGDRLGAQEARTLERAITIALIASNPSFLDDENPNAAHICSSSDNARIVGYSLRPGGAFAFAEGSLVPRVNLVSARPADDCHDSRLRSGFLGRFLKATSTLTTQPSWSRSCLPTLRPRDG